MITASTANGNKKAKVLVAENIDASGVKILSRAAEVHVKHGLSPAQLLTVIGDYDALIVRSATTVSAALIEAGKNLRVIGRAGVGVDNVDVKAATDRGIVVVNSAEGNTVAAAEHTVAMMLSLARFIPQATKSLAEGKWDRQLVGVQLSGKTLGIIGLGKVGLHVATICRAAGMDIVGYDPFMTPERAKQMALSGITITKVDDVFRAADFLTLHVPKTAQTIDLVNEASLSKMKPSARIVNCSRGGVVNEAALAKALVSGKIAGAALDVFNVEPLSRDSPLVPLIGKLLIVTPHLGASTADAQVNVAVDVAGQVADILEGKPPRAAVNLPGLRREVVDRTLPWMDVAETLGRFVEQLFSGPIQSLEVIVSGALTSSLECRLVVAAAIKGVFHKFSAEERITFVNAQLKAERNGVQVIETKSPSQAPTKIELVAKGVVGPALLEQHSAAAFTENGLNGTMREIWIANVDGFRVQVPATRHMLLHYHVDQPGAIGMIGTLLGKHGINISSMQVGRKQLRGQAVTILSIDNAVPPEVQEELRKMPNVVLLKYSFIDAHVPLSAGVHAKL